MMKPRGRARRGQALVETALVLPFLMMLVLGSLEVGMMLNAYITVVNLGREGARIAADGATNCEIRSTLALEGDRHINFSADGAVLIVRGQTANTSGAVSAWNPDTAGRTLRVQQANINGTSMTNQGYPFVLVEVQYTYRPITPIPFNPTVPLTSRAVLRTAATNSNAC